MYYVDKDVKKTYRVFPRQERGDYLRLDMNESVEGLPEDFVKEVLSEITPEFLSTYPEPNRFIRAYSDFSGVPFNQITVTNGTDSAIRYILSTFGEKGKDVVTVSPTFEMYRVNCSILGLNHVPVSYKEDFSIDIDSIISAITDDTRIVVLINPNNPIGNTYSESEGRRIFDAARSHNAVVVVDEAYHYFTDESLLPLAKSYDNVILMRTFSKLMSLAALRLGVVIAGPELIGFINNGKLTFEANSLALLFGERLIKRPDIIESMIAREREGKEYLSKWLEKNDYEYIPCKGNYILFKPKTNPKELTGWLEAEEKILVHDYGSGMLSEYIRISTAGIASMERVCRAIEKFGVCKH